jgi:hypothetical protein
MSFILAHSNRNSLTTWSCTHNGDLNYPISKLCIKLISFGQCRRSYDLNHGLLKRQRNQIVSSSCDERIQILMFHPSERRLASIFSFIEELVRNTKNHVPTNPHIEFSEQDICLVTGVFDQEFFAPQLSK